MFLVVGLDMLSGADAKISRVLWQRVVGEMRSLHALKPTLSASAAIGRAQAGASKTPMPPRQQTLLEHEIADAPAAEPRTSPTDRFSSRAVAAAHIDGLDGPFMTARWRIEDDTGCSLRACRSSRVGVRSLCSVRQTAAGWLLSTRGGFSMTRSDPDVASTGVVTCARAWAGREIQRIELAQLFAALLC